MQTRRRHTSDTVATDLPGYTNDAADLQRVADVETCLDGFKHAADVKIVADSDYVAGHILQLAGFEQGMV